MPLADLSTPAARIYSALEKLQEAWADAQEVWNDNNSSKLEEEHLVPLAMTVKLSLDAVGRINETLINAERVCSEERESLW